MNDSSALNTGPVQGTSTAGERAARGRPSKAVVDYRSEVIRTMTAAGATAAEMAERLGVSHEAICGRLRRARRKLNLPLDDSLSLMRCRRLIAIMYIDGLLDEVEALETTGLSSRKFRSLVAHVQEPTPERSPAVK